jgi:hypothetical protein
MTWQRIIAALAVIGAAGCGPDYGSPDLDYRVIGVRGVVRDAAQSPVSGATVTITAYLLSCSGGLDGSAATQTGTDGKFATILGGSTLSQPRCVRVSAAKGGLTGSAVLSTVVFPVRVPKDTINLDVVLGN